MVFDFEASDLLLILGTLIIPSLGIFVIAGCGVDLLLNIVLTLLGYLPGHVHAFYLLYIFYTRRSRALSGGLSSPPPNAPLVFSETVLMGRSDVFSELNRGPAGYYSAHKRAPMDTTPNFEEGNENHSVVEGDQMKYRVPYGGHDARYHMPSATKGADTAHQVPMKPEDGAAGVERVDSAVASAPLREN